MLLRAAKAQLSAPSLRVYGSSLPLAQGHITVPSDRYFSKLAAALGGARAVKMNYGVSGAKLLAPSAVSLQAWAHPWSHQADRLGNTFNTPATERPPMQPIIVFHFGINDGGGLWNEPYLAATFQAALEAIVRMARAGYAWRDTSGAFTYLGAGWNVIAASNSRGGSSHARATAGNLKFTTPASFPGGTMTFYPLVRNGDGETWRCRVSIDGAPYSVTVDATANIGCNLNANQSPVPVVVPNVPAGAGHTVELDFDNVGAGGFYFVGATLASSFPPIVLLVDQPILPTMPPGSWPNLTAAIIAALNATHDAVAGLFTDGKVRHVNLSAMNAIAGYWQDDLHYNPSGHAAIADACLAELRRVPGGIPVGYSAGPVLDFAGLPDWSGDPGDGIFDSTNTRWCVANSITPGDWKVVAVA